MPYLFLFNLQVNDFCHPSKLYKCQYDSTIFYLFMAWPPLSLVPLEYTQIMLWIKKCQHRKNLTPFNTIQQHSTPTFSIPNTPHHFLSLNSTPIQLLLSPVVFSFNTLPHHLLFLILI